MDDAVIIGLYGVPGSGKTYMLNQLQTHLGEDHFIFYHSLRAHQTLLPDNASPRLETARLPLIQLTDPAFVNSIFSLFSPTGLQIPHATDKPAAKLLMTPMRDAIVTGPALREAQRQAGWYLAMEFMTRITGVEERSIPHVQGHHTTGHRLHHEQQTLIVPLMRGGEAMALGVNDAFPLATFLHANTPSDIEGSHLQGRVTIVLVDSVVNSGKSIAEFIRHVRNFHATIRIVVVAGVVQSQAVSGGNLGRLVCCGKLAVVALRLSENKYTGHGTTDTGNRLFNTVHLD